MLADGWVRALSLKDPVMANVYSLDPSVQDKVAMRTDWTGTGAYGGLAGFALDGVAEMEQGFISTLVALSNISQIASMSMPAQGVAVMSPPFMILALDNNDGLPPPIGSFAPNFPEFFDEEGWPPEWPSTSRSIQNAEGSIADFYIRSLFGWRPNWIAASTSDAASAIDAAIWLPAVSRGLSGTLTAVRTPYGPIDLVLGDQGITWNWTRMSSKEV